MSVFTQTSYVWVRFQNFEPLRVGKISHCLRCCLANVVALDIQQSKPITSWKTTKSRDVTINHNVMAIKPPQIVWRYLKVSETSQKTLTGLQTSFCSSDVLWWIIFGHHLNFYGCGIHSARADFFEVNKNSPHEWSWKEQTSYSAEKFLSRIFPAFRGGTWGFDDKWVYIWHTIWFDLFYKLKHLLNN